ncbi:MAG: DUF106 domain-containing protein [bacterium]|nr:DUF106 domain-containing protein [bacterium]
MFESVMHPVMSPLLKLPDLAAIVLVSFLIAFLITIIYKYTTNQSLMKDLKTEMKAFQKQVKELKGHPEKAMAVQKQAMQTNMKYMMHSFKSTIFTFIPIILIFGWLSGHYGYLPIQPNQEFTTDMIFEDGFTGDARITVSDGLYVVSGSSSEITEGKASWVLKGDEGEHLIEYEYNDATFSKNVIITNEKGNYAPVTERIKEAGVKSINVNNEKNKLINLFGWRIGWLGTYIICSIVFSLLMRKILRVY